MTDLEMTDEELLADFINGNKRSLEMLIKRYEKEIYNFVSSRIGNHADADDVCQDSFIKVSQKANQFKGHASFKSWLYSIAKNECKMYWKGRTTGINKKIDWNVDPESLDLSTDDSGLNMCQIEEEKTMIQSYIKRLPEKQQMTIELRFNHQFKFREIAETMGCSVSTAKANCRHALARLKELMTDKGDR